jgi:hypothetical protein
MGQHVGDIGSGLFGRPWGEDEDRAASGGDTSIHRSSP